MVPAHSAPDSRDLRDLPALAAPRHKCPQSRDTQVLLQVLARKLHPNALTDSCALRDPPAAATASYRSGGSGADPREARMGPAELLWPIYALWRSGAAGELDLVVSHN